LKLKVFLAGRVALESDGVVIDEERFPGRQGRLLFACLVAEQGRPVPRDELADALWGEAPPATSDKALTVLASKLRGLLAEPGIGAATLTSAFGSYRLNLPDGAWVDIIAAADALREAEAALAADDFGRAKAAATRAASLARPSFLPGEEGAWVEGKRRELEDILRRALSCLAEACLRSGDAAEAASWAEETIALEPYRETGYRQLMAAHAAAGNRAEALRVYEQCRQLLATELGAYPSPETESIYRELLRAPSPSALSDTGSYEFVVDLTQAASGGKLDPVIGRAEEIEQTIEILCRRIHKHPVLLGEPGVGKTAIVEEIARLIATRQVPDALAEKRLVALDFAAIAAASESSGEFAKRLKNVVNETIQRGDTILFIDRFHSLVGAGATEGPIAAASILKPVLARGELQTISITTPGEYEEVVAQDPTFKWRFEPVLVYEPTAEETIEILRGLKVRYERFHHVRISDEAIVAAVELADRYIDGFRPSKAIDLIDRTISRVRLGARANDDRTRGPARGRREPGVTAEHVAAVLSREIGTPVP
jgi:DNA-binding SARP family transcriptional activator